MKYSSLKIICWTGLCLLIACEENPDPVNKTQLPGCDGDINGTNCVFYQLPEGETATYPVGTEITASEGMDIKGTIIVTGDQPGDFTLTAKNGDIIINGTIRFTDPVTGGRVANGQQKTAGFGNSMVVNASNGNIKLEPESNLQAGNGKPGSVKIVETILSGAEQLVVTIRGNDGEKGGDIFLNAPLGDLSFPPLQEIADRHTLLAPGSGGKGGLVEVDGEVLQLQNPLDTLKIIGGNGGNSGTVVVNVATVTGAWSREEIGARDFDIIDGGTGGLGGNAMWVIREITPTYIILKNAVMMGGKGGDGMVNGGRGGHAVGHFNRQINEIGEDITDLFVYSGNGGDVFASPFILHQVRGGSGGGFLAVGAHGWSGGEMPGTDIVEKNGANGGNVTVVGGKGGTVGSTVSAYQAIGGHGALSEDDRITFVEEMIELYALPGNASYTDLFFSILAGNGGDGESVCLIDPGLNGGNGGNTGELNIFGGTGGTSQANAEINTRGNGGDIWQYGALRIGNGGDGNPPGQGGEYEIPGVIYPGTGNKDGTIVVGEYAPTGGEDGENCPEVVCEVGSTFTGNYQYRKWQQYSSGGMLVWGWWEARFTSIQEITSGSSSQYVYMKKEIGPDANGETLEEIWTIGDEEPPFSDAQFLTPFSPLCTYNGGIYLPGSGDMVILSKDRADFGPGDPGVDEILIMGSTGCVPESIFECNCDSGILQCE